MTRLLLMLGFVLSSSFAAAQAPPPPPAVDVSAADIKAFLDMLPSDRVSDLPIRVADVGGYKVGVYGVFRPKASVQTAIAHETTVSEIYYMLEGTATLVTGGTMVDREYAGPSPNTKRPNYGQPHRRRSQPPRRAWGRRDHFRDACRTGGAPWRATSRT